MKLDEMMREAVADTTVDGPRLTAAARSQGATLRRRRRLSALAGGVAASVVVGLGVAAVLPGERPSPDVASSSGSGTVTLDGRSTAAVLASLVDEVAGGSLGGYAGQGLSGGAPDTFAKLELTPTGEGVGVVEVNVQGRQMLRETPDRCVPSVRDCTRVELASGDVLLVGGDDASASEATGLTRWVTLRSERLGLRISVSATNGFDLPSEQWDVTRPDPVLTDRQLIAIATDPVWAFEVPAAYAEEGADLTPYDDLDVPEEGDWVE